jgi:hypothetical protein
MTEAQNQYAKPLALRGMYTPMLVVSGAMHTSNSAQAAKRIEDDGKAAVVATVTATGKRTAAHAFIEANVTLPKDVNPAVEVTVAVAENNLKTEIKAGELKGHTVTEHGVVRFLTKPAVIDKDGNIAVQIPLGKDWKAESLYAVVIVRDPATRKVLGANRLDWKDVIEQK